ncbi:MAG: 2-oxo acid dehydrogenase subunit E2 [Acidobacteria bacterium]|nr:MAG: 2-oxo acid dehydrogenase subunit E2 [Acidobacteriota bacterium]
MANPIVMPKLGQMTEESTVIRWLKHEGDSVAKGDVLLEIETDKAAMEIESFYDGTLLKIVVAEGETVPVMATLGFVGEPGESIPQPAAETREQTRTEPVRVSPSPSAPGERAAPVDWIKISPRAAGLAAARGIDVRQIRGSGPGGRIVERDVVAFEQAPIVREPQVVEGEPLSKMRRVIARRLADSYRTAPHFFATVKVDMSEIERVREHLKTGEQHASVTDFVIKAAASSLVDFPLCNSTTDGQTVKRGEGIHVGMAVALEEGLVVPVIRDADQASLSDISRRTKELAAKAKAGRLGADEMTGGTFTVSNLGMLDVDSFTAIINPGESAILAVSSTRLEPVVANHEIGVRPIMKMTLSSDHRLIDGALAARFLNAIRSRLEDKKLWWEELK